MGAGRMVVFDQLERWRSEDAARPVGKRVHKFLTQESFAGLCAGAGHISSPEHFLRFLHHAGVVFYREGLFEDRIILDQQWALDAIYTAFDRERTYPLLKTSRGRFTRELLGRLAWQEHAPDEQALFLSMMESCGIAFAHARDDRNPRLTEYIATEFLPGRPALADVIASRWHGDNPPTERRLRFDLLHTGLVRAIIARVGREARVNADYWSTGVLFFEATHGSDAIIEAIEDETGWGGEIRIACRAGRATELCARLCEEVTEMAQQLGLSPQPDESPQEERGPMPDATDPLAITAPPSSGPKWYVSYAWGDDESREGIARGKAVDDLCTAAAAQGIAILRDRDQIGNGDSIRRFMNELAAGDRIIVILSAKYLHSANCMFELYQGWLKAKADSDLFVHTVRAFRLPCAAIGTPAGRAAVAQHWHGVVESMESVMKFLGPQDLNDLRLAQNYANNVGDILYTINDRVSPRDWDAFLAWAFALP